MSYFFTSQRNFLDLHEIEEKFRIVNSENKCNIIVEGEGRSFSEAYEKMILSCKDLVNDEKNSQNFRGLEIGIYDCHSQTIGRTKRVSGLVFCMKPNPNHRVRDILSNQLSPYQ